MSPAHAIGSWTPARADDRGFALPMVVFLLFAIGVAAAAGFQIVQTEAKLSSYTRDAGKALSIANSGLRQYLSQTNPNVTDTAQYAIDGGNAEVWARRIFRNNFPREAWMITARGTYGDAFATANESPAERTVRQLVTFRRAPLNVKGLLSNTGTISQTGGTLNATDQASVVQCPDAPRPNIISRFAPGAGAATAQAVLDTLNIPWSTLIDPSFAVDYTNAWPTGFPVSEWPIVRFTGNVNVNSVPSPTTQRRGLLIVVGTLTLQTAFNWDGIILAGRLATPVGHSSLDVEGVLVGGLAGVPAGVQNISFTAGSLRFHSCKIQWAGAKAAIFETTARTWTEVF